MVLFTRKTKTPWYIAKYPSLTRKESRKMATKNPRKPVMPRTLDDVDDDDMGLSPPIGRFPDDDDDDGIAYVQPDLAEFMANANNQVGLIKVFRQKSGDARGLAWMFDFKPGDYTHSELLGHLRDNYGGGNFCIQTYGGVSNQRLGTEKITVEAPKNAASLVSANPGDSMITLLREQAAQQQTMLMGLMTAIAGRPAPVAPEGLSLGDVLALVDRLGGKKDSAGDVMDTLLKGIELGKQVAGIQPEDDGIIGMLKQIAPAIAPAMMAFNQQPAQTPPELRQNTNNPNAGAIAQPGNGAPILTRPEQEPKPEPDAVPAQSQSDIMVLVKMLVRAAILGADPFVYADVVIDQLGDDNAMALVHNPAVLGQILATLPEAKPCGAWFRSMLEAINEILTAPGAGDTISDIDGNDAIDGKGGALD
jgi:hypothetical protein